MARRTLLALFALAAAQAAVTRVDITDRGDVPFVNYERLSGKVYFAVDPKVAANHQIIDVDLAPRNAKGLVEFSADLYILRPKLPAASNGTALVEISNRGGRGLLNQFDFVNGGSLSKREDFGDPLLFDNGYTLVWVGWEWDVPENAGMRLYAPVAPGVTGSVRSQILVDRPATSASLGDRTVTPYPVADRESGTLTVRDKPNGPLTTIPRNQWKFSADGLRIELASGFEPGRIYEIVYKTKDPVIAGLGSAAIRDYVTYMKQRGEVKRAIGYGNSQSGRFLRKFLYDGFNADEQGHKVFDGVWAHVAAGGRGGFNNRFAQPSRDGHPWMNLYYPNDLMPFTDEAETDGALTDGLLARAQKDKVVPKIFYTNGSYEYFARDASIIHTSIDGKKDVSSAADTRMYFISGTQHVANTPPTRQITQNITNPTDYRYAMRALLVAMNAWITNGTPPPDSKIPHVNKDDLVSYSAFAFPKIPGVAMPSSPGVVSRMDFGPDFRTRGIIAFDPPKIGNPYPVLVPQVNSDGNETSGIRLPEVSVPLATHTGWNLRDPRVGAPDMLYSMIGSMIPFAKTRAERQKSGDPRLSVEERYRNRDDYVAKVEAAAHPLIQDRLLLEKDVPRIKNRAADRWDWLMSQQ